MDLGPFNDITQVIRMPDGSLLAYDAKNHFVVELEEDGLEQLQELLHIQVTDLSREAPQLPPGYQTIRPVGAPIAGYVPSVVGGSNFHAPVRAKTTDIVFLKGGLSPKIVDDVRLRRGDTVLVTEQPDHTHNGIYEVWKEDYRGQTWLRSGVPTAGQMVMVAEGTCHESTIWVYDDSVETWIQVGASGGGISPPSQEDLSWLKALLENDD